MLNIIFLGSEVAWCFLLKCVTFKIVAKEFVNKASVSYSEAQCTNDHMVAFNLFFDGIPDEQAPFTQSPHMDHTI